jgi:hypothetical protein
MRREDGGSVRGDTPVRTPNESLSPVRLPTADTYAAGRRFPRQHRSHFTETSAESTHSTHAHRPPNAPPIPRTDPNVGLVIPHTGKTESATGRDRAERDSNRSETRRRAKTDETDTTRAYPWRESRTRSPATPNVTDRSRPFVLRRALPTGGRAICPVPSHHSFIYLFILFFYYLFIYLFFGTEWDLHTLCGALFSRHRSGPIRIEKIRWRKGKKNDHERRRCNIYTATRFVVSRRSERERALARLVSRARDARARTPSSRVLEDCVQSTGRTNQGIREESQQIASW